MSYLDSHSPCLVDLDDSVTSTDAVPPLMSEPSASLRKSVEPGGELSAARSRFAERIAEVSALFQTAVDAMKTASCAIVETGRPPDYHLVQSLGDCHRLFLRLRHDVWQYAESIGATSPPADQITSLSELSLWLDSLGPKTLPVITPPVETPPAEALAEPEPVRPIASAIFTEHEPSQDVAETPDEPSSVEPEPIPAPTAEYDAPGEDIRPETPDELSVVEPNPALAAESDAPGEDIHAETRDEPSVAEPDLVPAPADEYDAPGEDIRHAALSLLGKTLRLTVRNGSELLPLQECLKRAEALRELILTSSPSSPPLEAELLAKGDHPFVGLLNMVEEVGTLTDAQWAEVHSQVSGAFGRELAVAASRGRLLIRPDLA